MKVRDTRDDEMIWRNNLVRWYHIKDIFDYMKINEF